MSSCESERNSLTLAQESFDAVKADYDLAASGLSKAKTDLAICEGNSGDAMSVHSIFDMHCRIRNNGGTGSGNIVEETETDYFIETNYHVAGGVGKRNSVDIWLGGDLKKSGVPAVVVESWFKSTQSVDIARLRMSKSDVGLSLPVVPYATSNDNYEPRTGDHGFFGACAEGLWPRPRSGNILDVRGGLIYYEPNAIGGDSGSPVVGIVNGQLRCIGRTAWSTRGSSGRWVGLAMTWQRIEQIKRGEVGDYPLPAETKYPGDLVTQDDQTFGL